ncbi:MAG: cbb3-type cytochrome c oxidase N-terminal domain-containing protein [Bacteroidota bacterium]
MFKKYSSISYWVKALVVVISIGFSSNDAFAAGPPKASELSNPLAQVLLVIIVGLLLAIGLLANVILGAAQVYLQRYKDERKKTSSNAGKFLTVALLCLTSSALFAAVTPDAATAVVEETAIGGLSLTSFYVLVSVIFLELLILWVLLANLKKLLSKEAAVALGSEEEVVTKSFSFVKWWDNFNSFKPLKEESSIDLGHDYDGIRELDNRLPPWWLYGFYLTIIFAGLYLYRYHVAKSAPLSKQELAISLEQAAAEKETYLKKSANNIDENTVVYLTSPADHEAGKAIFITICAACHLPDGGGLVGPNMTDNYFLHGGSIKDLFKTIKYGYPEKGMKSWKDDYSPTQIAQLASYVKSLVGTKPAVPKAPQGVLYEEKASGGTAPAADSTKAKTDSTKAVAPAK